MTALWILGIILGILLLIGLLPVGAYLRYDGETLAQLCIGPVRLKLYPAKTKNRKQREKAAAKAEKKKKAKAQAKKDKKEKSLIQKKRKDNAPKEPLKDKIEGLLPFVKLAVELLGKFRRKLLIRKFVIRIRLAGGDPAKLAINNGRAWAAIAAAMPILKSSFRIRSSDVQVSPDFLGDKTEIFAELHIRLVVGDTVILLIRYAIKSIKLYFNRKKQQNLKKAVQQ